MALHNATVFNPYSIPTVSLKKVARIAGALAVAAAAFTSTPAAAGDTNGLDGLAPKVELKVYDEKTGKLLFIGEERNTLKDQIISRVTTYTDQAGKKLQEERVQYHASTLRILSQSSRNFVTGTKVDMTPLEKESTPEKMAVTLTVQESAKEEPKTKKLISDNLYVGNVMHHLIVRNWQKLTAQNQMVVVKLVAPSRLDFYTFRLSSKKLPVAKTTRKTIQKTTSTEGSPTLTTKTTVIKEAPQARVIMLEPDSWLIRSLVDPMEFFYENGRLMEFRGITPVVIDDDPYRRTRFKFHYPSS